MLGPQKCLHLINITRISGRSVWVTSFIRETDDGTQSPDTFPGEHLVQRKTLVNQEYNHRLLRNNGKKPASFREAGSLLWLSARDL